METLPITETAFFKYLSMLSVHKRAEHLCECALNQGEMFFELAEFFKEYHPVKLALLVEKYIEERA